MPSIQNVLMGSSSEYLQDRKAAVYTLKEDMLAVATVLSQNRHGLQVFCHTISTESTELDPPPPIAPPSPRAAAAARAHPRGDCGGAQVRLALAAEWRRRDGRLVAPRGLEGDLQVSPSPHLPIPAPAPPLHH